MAFKKNEISISIVVKPHHVDNETRKRIAFVTLMELISGSSFQKFKRKI